MLAALAGNMASVLRVHPHTLSYFNELAGGPDKEGEHLLCSNIDQGRDLLFLKRWLEEHPQAQPRELANHTLSNLHPGVVGID